MNYVIIGNSAAAVGTIEGIRQIDKTGKITVISDEKYHTYSRPLISYWLMGKVTDKNIYYRSADFYEKNGVETMFDTRVTKIDPAAKNVVLADGSTVPYDKLMVATGSKPFVPPMNGMEKIASCHTFMSYDSVKAIKAEVKPGMKVLIIGAGLIGLKAAEALNEYKADITVVDMADRILPSILDVRAGSIMKKHIESKGTKFILGTSVDEFSEHSAKLKNGAAVDFDMVIIAVGVRPNTELVSEAGGKVERGIICDLTQKTTIDDVYAAGDCTVSHDASSDTDRILALLPNAYMQGEVAGRNMAGAETKYENAIPMNAIGFFGLHIITAGSYDGEEYVEEHGNNYKKLVFKDGLLKGFILMGDVKRAGTSMLLFIYIFFAFTTIGQSNSSIRRIRTAFNPTKDASYIVRKENQKKLATYLKYKPFGEGLGLSGDGLGVKISTRFTTSIPTDSWYVKIWVETGIVGLILYLSMIFFTIGWGGWIIATQIKDLELKGLLSGLLCGIFGMFINAYANSFWGQFPTMIIAFMGLTFVLNGPYFDKEIRIKKLTVSNK